MTSSAPRRPDVEGEPLDGPAAALEKDRGDLADPCVDAVRTDDALEPSLADLVLALSNGARVDLDEQYTLTAFVVHRGHGEESAPILVELLDHGPGAGSARWRAIAHDEVSGAATQLGQGDSAEQALAGLDWRSLE